MCENKTPVTILQELCVKKKESVPHYEYLGEEIVKENEKIFSYKVHCLGQEALGTGKSKKDAKHDAACAILKLLTQHFPEVNPEMSFCSGQNFERDAVSELLNLCVQRNLPKAEFVLMNASGPSHAPMFTVSCHVASMQRSDTHSTKKGAKQLAAQKMLSTILEMPVPDESLMQVAIVDDLLGNEEQQNHKLFKTYREWKNSDNKKQLGVKVCDRHNFFKEMESEKVAECRRIVCDSTIVSADDKVQQMMTALELKYKISNVDFIESPMKSFELTGADYDCFLMFYHRDFYPGVYEYLKLMLSI